MDYLKIGKAAQLKGRDKKLYRFLEILPGFLSWGTLILLLIFSYYYPVIVAYFLIAFDIYWLLLVFFLAIHLYVAYKRMGRSLNTNWRLKCEVLGEKKIELNSGEFKMMSLKDLIHLVIFPIYNESMEVINQSVQSIINSKYPSEKIILVLTYEERGGAELKARIKTIQEKYKNRFRSLYITMHPDGIEGELKGKGSNQAWAAQHVKKDIVDKENIDYDQILVSVFDIDTVISSDYFYCLSHKFLSVEKPYKASYQPVPVYNNNLWQAPFFARVAASSNTFWQMMQQVRNEKLATYSSHSMTWRALVEIGFWSTNMVSEDSRIFWHCFCYYKGDYRVEPLDYPVSMDVCMDENSWKTFKNLYSQQLRWGWGVENIPYLIFNTMKQWKEIPKGKFISRILVQLYGFHSWATNALIIAVIGWMPMLIGGDRFNVTVLSSNLPIVTRTLMMFAMFGLIFSAIISTLLLPKRPKKYGILKNVAMVVQWAILPISIIIFGSIPGLHSQTKLMFKKYMGFWVTPKAR
jgi:cellulose synthase/poly-beta-1,6-N-acetylglucosamine synthase-like glycosyltransferase